MMARLGYDGPYAHQTTAYITHTSLMAAVHAVCDGGWPLGEFSLCHADCFELAAKRIREAIEAAETAGGK